MMSRRASVLAAALCTVAAVLSACATQPPAATSVVETPGNAFPLPEGAEIAEPSAPAPTSDSCGDPNASLRPDGVTTGPTLDAIRARGRLIVGLDAGSNLLSYRDPATGEITGFDVDIAREIARDLLGNPDLVDFRILSSAEREEALQSSTVDIVAKTMSITCARRELVDFSTTYLRADQRVLVVRDSGIRNVSDLVGRRVCIVDGTTSLERMREVQHAASILTVPSWADCLVVLQQGQVDAVSTDDTILAGFAAQDPYLEVVGESLGTESYGIGITRGKDDLVRFVNGTLERIRADGTWADLYDRYLSVLGPAPEPPAPTYVD
ncbi:polar amino acid transport system substrate-binding protein [Rhodococcus coprophilus]|uniref:Amino acid ABC transporter ATP-binding protein n=2 Tax=Rhodococcus coprophilus TaxID=38310 RepID=A0A2X4UAM6_9NOCA|nr:polar amino acid transport system substrate-binding protein [Rhodococcus coprophilus]SQI36826.1 amino acid ABC transporter ATP-binding protein [Rhodococcus coprophilus]